MDEMTDDEVRYVIAHEIGHVALGHSKRAFQVAYAASAAREAAASSGSSTAAVLSTSELGDLGEKAYQGPSSLSVRKMKLMTMPLSFYRSIIWMLRPQSLRCANLKPNMVIIVASF